MALSSLQGTFGALSEAEVIANELGINSWQLSQGSYNGVTFHVLNSTQGFANQLDGLISATEQLVGAQTMGQDNSNLPSGTNTVSTGITDIGSRKLAIFELPNNSDVFEDMGWRGEIYIIQGMIYGPAGSQALSNIMNAFINDHNVAFESQNVLVHPVLGTIPNPVFLIGYKRVYNPNLWRSTMYEFVFRSSAPVFQTDNFNSNIVTNLNTVINDILSISTSLLNIWGSIVSIQNAFASTGNTLSLQQALQGAQKSVKIAVNTSLTTAQLMVNNLKPDGYSNLSLSQAATTSTTNIPSYFYFINNMTPNDVNSIINNNNDNIQEAITSLSIIKDNTIYNSTSLLIKLQSNLIALAATLLNSYFGNLKQFLVPYDIDLLSVCIINNLDYNAQSNVIYLLNQSIIPSANYIPKGTNISIPISSNKVQRSII